MSEQRDFTICFIADFELLNLKKPDQYNSTQLNMQYTIKVCNTIVDAPLLLQLQKRYFVILNNLADTFFARIARQR